MAPTERSSLQTIEQIKTEALGYLRSIPSEYDALFLAAGAVQRKTDKHCIVINFGSYYPLQIGHLNHADFFLERTAPFILHSLRWLPAQFMFLDT